MGGINQSNISRFAGFANIYDKYRPVTPTKVIDIIKLYLPSAPNTVVDIGSGTGLSTLIWKDHAKSIVGIEPNDDMRAIAEEKAMRCDNLRFIKGYSNCTGLDSNLADVITISQAFHWMDSESTICEADRVLKSGGVFAVYDCDWPPVIDWKIEHEYNNLRDVCDTISISEQTQVVRKNKNEHLKTIKKSDKFQYVREIVFDITVPIDADRMVGIALSQGGIQAALKMDDSVEKQVRYFNELVHTRLGNKTVDTLFSYRMRIGIK